MFENIDASRVPTGILLNYGIKFVDLDRFNGESLNETNYATYNIIEQINSTLFSSQIAEITNGLPTPQTLNDLWKINNYTNHFALAGVLHEYAQ